MLGNCQIFHNHGHNTSKQNNLLFTCLNPHIMIIFHLLRLVAWAQKHNKKDGEKNESEIC